MKLWKVLLFYFFNFIKIFKLYNWIISKHFNVKHWLNHRHLQEVEWIKTHATCQGGRKGLCHWPLHSQWRHILYQSKHKTEAFPWHLRIYLDHHGSNLSRVCVILFCAKTSKLIYTYTYVCVCVCDCVWLCVAFFILRVFVTII